MSTLTKDQINLFTQKAKAAGLSDFQIAAELKKKEQELSGGSLNYSGGQAVTNNLPPQQPSAQNQAGSNQNATGVDVTTGNEADQKAGFIGNFVKGLTEGAVNYFKYVGEAGYQTGRFTFDPVFRKSVLGEDLTLEESASLASQDATAFLDPEKVKDNKSIAVTGVKAIAGGASYAIPFGKGASIASKALIPGFSAAALSETSREGSTPSSVVEQGVFGAVTAGALEGVSKVASRIKDKASSLFKASDSITEGTRNIKVKASIFGADKEKAINKTLDAYGFKGTAQDQYEQLAPTMQKIEDKITEFVKNNPDVSVKTADLKKNFLDSLKSALRSKDLTNKQAVTEVSGYLDDLRKAAGGKEGVGFTFGESEAVGLDQLRQMKKVLNEDYGSVYKKLENGTSLNSREKVIAAAWNSLDSAVKDVAPELKDLLLDESNLYQAAGPLASARSNPPVLRAFGTSVPAWATQKLRDFSSSTLKKLGIVADNIPEGEMPTTLTKLAALTPVAMKSQGLTDEEIAQVEDLKSSLSLGQSALESTSTPNAGQDNAGAQDYGFSQTPSPMNPFGSLTKRQVLALALADGASPSDLEGLSKTYDLVGGESGTISEEAQGTATTLRTEYFKRSQENNWIDALNSYKKVEAASSTPQGDISLIFAFMKMLDPNSVVREGEFATAEKTAGIPAQIVQQYNKALSGQRLTEDQRKAYKDEAGKVFSVYQERQAPIDAYYQTLAQKYGLDPSLVGVGLYR